jgi:hypothetical protein
MPDDIEPPVSDQQDVSSPADAGPEQGEPLGGGQPAGDAGSAPAAAPAAAAPPVNYWDTFRTHVPQFQGMDDRSIAGHLWQSMQRERAAQQALAEYQRILPVAREYQQYRPQFEEWRKSQQASQAATQQQAKPEQKPPWDPPKIREAYKQYLVKDEHGRETIHPDAPLDAKHELYELQQYKANFAKSLLEDPEKALSPFIEKVATEKAQQIVQNQFGDVALKGYVANLEHEHRDWLIDAQTGQPTAEGEAVQHYIGQMRENGITNPEVAWEMATSLVERDMQRQLLNQLLGQGGMPQQAAMAPRMAPAAPAAAPRPPAPAAQAPAAPPSRDQQNMEFLRREASRNPSPKPAGDLNPQGRPRGRQLKGEDLFRQLLAEQAEADGLLV